MAWSEPTTDADHLIGALILIATLYVIGNIVGLF
ncbi:protein of unknown function [Bradyrhizobium vignae]|uniref:Uncharacterized protein n=1 Tax=Bradyrhizobium vignae TaxID=1549949 RepID=A0A2U3PPV8_9BRAD|nr:protein of unknown function [Bradyrhizobium vignae]